MQVSLAWPDPIFVQGRYCLQYKRPTRLHASHIATSIITLYGHRLVPNTQGATKLEEEYYYNYTIEEHKELATL